jgi:putative aminopeptidase FrvX
MSKTTRGDVRAASQAHVRIGSILCMLSALSSGAVAEAQESDAAKLSSWVALDAPTGHEHLALGPLYDQLEGWSIDRNGNLLKTTGQGDPHRIVACGLDWNSYAVTQITEGGYLRLHSIPPGPGTGHRLWNQAHEGQQVRVLTRSGPIIGVTGVANAHFAFQHRNENEIVTANDIWLDIGATSAADVQAMGVRLLDPVVRNVPAWAFADEVAGPGAGARVGCAAMVTASTAPAAAGRTTWILSTQRVLGWVGMSGALVRLAPADELLLLGPGETARRDELLTDPSDALWLGVARSVGVESIRWLAPEVSDAGALVERIDLTEAEWLLGALRSVVGSSIDGMPEWVAAPPQLVPLNDDPDRLAGGREGARLSEFSALLDRLTEAAGVSAHEGPVRTIVLDEMPAWARARAETDDAGNIWVAFGPEGESTVFMAHMDEVGWSVEAIDPDGTVHLAVRGGAVISAWEGQPARLQLDSGTGADSQGNVTELNGVFLTRDNPDDKRPDEVTAWFGMDGDELASVGVVPGMPVTGYKESHRLGRFRYTARSLDDRAGTAALLAALNELDPDSIDHRVIFAWSVQEETGLIGARAMAERFGAHSRRIYSVDTFVTSDTPLESPHFAYAPLGAGPVLRSIESSSMVTPYELDRNIAIAADAGIAAQIGLTQGGTDGTTFAVWGAPNAGLSWPGRYSHSPAEVLDLRDLLHLKELILAMVRAEP